MPSREASVSKPAPSLSSPRLLHSLRDENKSILSLMADDRHIFVGGQCEDISVGLHPCHRLTASLNHQ
jgi:di- and tripeptidase